MLWTVELFRDRGDCYERSPRRRETLDRTDVESPVKHLAPRIVHWKGGERSITAPTTAPVRFFRRARVQGARQMVKPGGRIQAAASTRRSSMACTLMCSGTFVPESDEIPLGLRDSIYSLGKAVMADDNELLRSLFSDPWAWLRALISR